LLVIVVGGNRTPNILNTPLPNSSTPATKLSYVSQMIRRSWWELNPWDAAAPLLPLVQCNFFANKVIYRFEEELVVPFKRVFGSEAARIDFV